MPRKKKKSGKKIFQFIGSAFAGFFSLLVKCIPFVIVAALIFFGFTLSKNYLLNDPNFLITNLQITTNVDYPKEDVASRGNIASGENIFTVDLKQISSSLLSDPRVKEVTIKKVFPNSLDISLLIREGYAYFSLPSRKDYYLIDKEGYLISKNSKDELLDAYPVIIDGATLRKRIGLGDQHSTGNISNAFFVVEYLKNEGYYAEFGIVEVMIDRLNSVSLKVVDGYDIKLGSTRLLENMDKFSHLGKVLEGENVGRIKYIDLRFDDIIVKK